ncbi:MAG: hypothetical protein HOC46_07065 [Candidatus Marinimicrobia bacterium]|jgi:hypothetical protein|nr:hypothetical protein [Candidatus Neomarinimicrobiota bacterium]MBT4593981.1 hypothetical protein [Candidatus Neomarinimicrobiota bacterium]
MKKFALIILLFWNLIQSQSISISGGQGQFVNHSENNNPVTAYQNFESVSEWSAGIEYPFNQAKFIQLNIGGIASSIPFSEDGGIVCEKTYPLDIRLFNSKSKMTGYGLGPTFTITNHSLLIFENTDFEISDIFNSVGVGINGLARVSFGPFYKIYLLMDIKARYVKAINFNGENRDFSNYFHDYGHVSISLGLGKKLTKEKP